MIKKRSSREMFELIKSVAEQDDRILAVMLNGSRSDSEAPVDGYQDFDIIYFVKDVAPFWDNREWLEEKFGKILLLQTPETMSLIPPDGDGDFVFLTIFEDGNRIDLIITANPYVDDGEPAVVLLDKCGMLSHVRPNPGFWHIKLPTQKNFSDCCNEFWWCLNNVAKGIARDELPYAADMLNRYVRDELNRMVSWYIGATLGFERSCGKAGKYFKRLLPPEIYARYEKTYFDAMGIKTGMYTMTSLFSDLAREAASKLGFRYNASEEAGLLEYAEAVFDGKLENDG